MIVRPSDNNHVLVCYCYEAWSGDTSSMQNNVTGSSLIWMLTQNNFKKVAERDYEGLIGYRIPMGGGLQRGDCTGAPGVAVTYLKSNSGPDGSVLRLIPNWKCNRQYVKGNK